MITGSTPSLDQVHNVQQSLRDCPSVQGFSSICRTASHTSRGQFVSGSWLRGDVTAVRKEFKSKTNTDVPHLLGKTPPMVYGIWQREYTDASLK